MEKQEVTKKKKSKARSIIEWVLFSLFLVVFVFAGAAMIDSMVHKKDNCNQSLKFGVGTFIVLTDSMEDDYKEGSAIFTYKDNLEKVVTSFREGNTVDITFYNSDCGVDENSVEFTHEQYKKVNGGLKIITYKVMTHRLMEVHENPDVEYGKGRYLFVAAGINDKGLYSLKGQYQLFTEKEYLGKVVLYSPVLGSIFSFVVSPIGLIVLLLIPTGYLIISYSIDVFKTLKNSEETTNSGPAKTTTLTEISDKDRERLKKELLEEMMNKKKGDTK